GGGRSPLPVRGAGDGAGAPLPGDGRRAGVGGRPGGPLSGAGRRSVPRARPARGGAAGRRPRGGVTVSATLAASAEIVPPSPGGLGGARVGLLEGRMGVELADL